MKGGEAVTLAQNANNYLASLVREHPSRFRFFATLPWSNPQAAGYGWIALDVACIRLIITVDFCNYFGKMFGGLPES